MFCIILCIFLAYVTNISDGIPMCQSTSFEQKLATMRATIPRNEVNEKVVERMITRLQKALDAFEQGDPVIGDLLRMTRDAGSEFELTTAGTTAEPLNYTSYYKYAEQWCCNDIDPGQTQKVEVIRAQIVTQSVEENESFKCGFLGFGSCSSVVKRTIQNTEYYISYEYIQVPASEWQNGCPDNHIVCCAGYVYQPKLKQCMTNEELEEFLQIVRDYQEELLLLQTLW